MKEYKQSPPDATEKTKSSPRQGSDTCARCRKTAPVRGRFYATIQGVRKFICAGCCAEIGPVGALIANAEAAERDQLRRRFAESRYSNAADRRAA